MAGGCLVYTWNAICCASGEVGCALIVTVGGEGCE